MMNDALLLKMLKKRSKNSIEALINKYNAYVGTIVFNSIGGNASKEDIEEVVQDVFVAIWNNSDNIENLKAYIGVTARNKSLNKLREVTYNSPIEQDVSDTRGEPERVLEGKELTSILFEEIEALGEPDNEIFIRYYYNNEKIKDIANTMGINLSTIKSKLKRGKEKLVVSISERRGYYE